MNLLRNLLSGDKPRVSAAPQTRIEPSNSQHEPVNAGEPSDNVTRRQLIHVLLRDTLKRHGIPTRWIECQVLSVHSRSRGQSMHIKLIVKQWDARLMQYAVAFQNALLTELNSFDPGAMDWLHGVSWQLDVGDSTAQRAMPPKSFWTEQGGGPTGAPSHEQAATPAEDPASEGNDPRADLQRLFDIRDQALASSGAQPGRSGSGQPDFEKTQPLGL